MNDDKKQLKEWEELDCDAVDFDELENKLCSDLEEQIADLKGLEIDRENIGNPDSIGETVMNVVWEQFINQVGVVAGKEFIKENQGLKLDLRDSAHIQTPENFAKGNIAEHNNISGEQLKDNYDRYQNKPHKKYRKGYVNPGMDSTLKRAGDLNKSGVETVTDIYTGKQIPTQTKSENGKNNPKAAQREHVISSGKIYENPSIQMANSDTELAQVINDPKNLQGYTTAERNNRKSNKSADDMEDKDKTKHWEKANQTAEEFIKEKEAEGEKRLKKEGRKTQREEAFRIGGKALRTAVMVLLADLIKDIIRELIAWFRAGKRKLNTFIDSVKKAIESFISNIKERLLNAGNTSITAIFTSIYGPVIGTLKKAWIFLKQGYNSVKQAIEFLKNSTNKDMPFSIKMMEVGKIVIVGLTAGGSIVLSEVIEKGLMTIPAFAFEIPLLGSLASIIGMFSGALVSGLIGALALNMIDRSISNQLKKENDKQQHEKKNEIINNQENLIAIKRKQVVDSKVQVAKNIVHRHSEAGEHFKQTKDNIDQNSEESDKQHKIVENLTEDINKQLEFF